MSTQHTQGGPPFRWTLGKSVLATTLFTLFAILIEVLIVLYAMSLGTTDPGLITFTWPTTITISPLFHIVPIAVVTTLVASWTYLTKKLATRPLEQKTTPQKHPKAPSARVEQKLKKTVWHRISQPRGPVKTTIIITLFFIVFTFIAVNFAYPQLIYKTVASGYQNDPGLRDFVSSVNGAFQGFNQALGPLGGIATTINNGILILSPGVRAAGTAVGNALIPLASIDSAGKYLAIQNIAAWITVLTVIFYVRYTRKSLRYRRR